jgi:diguanylate cyclase (GGDEF)-like protein
VVTRERGRKAAIGAGIAALSFAAAFFYYRVCLDDMVALQERQNVVVANAAANTLMPRFPSLPKVPRDATPSELRERPEVAALHAALREMMRGTDVVKVKVYAPTGITVYSGEVAQIGENKRDNEGFRRALLGETPSVFTHRDQIDAFEKRLADRDIVATYVPFQGADKASSAVFEVYTDVTQPLAQVRQRVAIVLGVFAAGLVLLGLAAGRAVRVVAETQRKVEREAGERRVRHQAYHDAMTGLPNRANFLEHLAEAVQRAQRNGGRLAVFMIDIDRFKLVNESFGHKVGDRLLRRVARRVGAVMPRDEKLFRVGGDEFAFLHASDNPARDAAEIGQRILAALSGTFQVNERAISVAVSIGVTIHPDDANDASGLVRCADAALFAAKSEGGSRVVFFTRQMSDRAGRQLELEAGLRRALKDGEFEVYYQPRYNAVDGRVVGVEALLRWRSSAEGKFVPPDEFVPVLEDTGLVLPVGRWVLQRAARQAQQWQARGLAPVRVSVNVSPRQFHSDDFVESVRMALRAADLAPQWLELELTERLLCEDTEQAVAKMQALKRLGVVLSIDDFGTGYSSLSYLHRFPIDFLKIDKSFVAGVAKGKRDAAIALAIIDMGHNLQIGLVAEGVESEEQAAVLRERGCHEMQGFLFSRPLSAPQVELRLAAANGRVAVDRGAIAAADAAAGEAAPEGSGDVHPADLASRVIAAVAQKSAVRITPASFAPTTFTESRQ